jgi:NADPH-dependent ferric siderophore reductase
MPQMSSDKPRRPRVPLSATVRRTEWLNPSLVRVVIAGGDLTRFAPGAFTDSYVKVLFLNPEGDYARPLDLEAVRATAPREHWPRLRTYTVRAWDATATELTLDFVVHGDEGIAGPWARDAAPGDEVLLLGPGGAYEPDPAADWHLLVGDESALPAIAASAERLPDTAVAHIFVEVDGPEHEIPLKLPTGAELTWVHRGSGPVGARLVEAVTAFDFPKGDVHAFVHGEAAFVKQLRALLFTERAVPRDRVSISGYWRKGVDDEGWRAIKADFGA